MHSSTSPMISKTTFFLPHRPSTAAKILRFRCGEGIRTSSEPGVTSTTLPILPMVCSFDRGQLLLSSYDELRTLHSLVELCCYLMIDTRLIESPLSHRPVNHFSPSHPLAHNRARQEQSSQPHYSRIPRVGTSRRFRLQFRVSTLYRANDRM